MIYLEYTSTRYPTNPGEEPSLITTGVELNVSSIAEGARLFMAFEAGHAIGGLELTSIGTTKRRGIDYTRWGGL